MGIYIPRKCPPLLTAAWLTEELHAIESAHNSHSKENFPDKCIPLAAMQARKGYFVEVAHGEHEAFPLDYAFFVVPVDCTWVRFSACAPVCDAASAFAIDYYHVDSDGLLGLTGGTVSGALTTPNTAVSGSVNVSLYPGDLMMIRFIDDATPVIARATVALTFKANHTS